MTIYLILVNFFNYKFSEITVLSFSFSGYFIQIYSKNNFSQVYQNIKINKIDVKINYKYLTDII